MNMFSGQALESEPVNPEAVHFGWGLSSQLSSHCEVVLERRLRSENAREVKADGEGDLMEIDRLQSLAFFIKPKFNSIHLFCS